MSHYMYMHSYKQRNFPMNTHTSPDDRPLGYWLKATDRLMAAEFARAFENEGITRREWRLLNVVDGTVQSGHPVDDRKLGRLIELGWIAPSEDGWSLTDEGQAAKKRLGTIVDGIRATIAEAVSPEDYATTIATLTQIAQALGWDENVPLPRKQRDHGPHRGHGRHRGGRWHGEHGHHGRGHRRGFAPHPSEASESWAHAEHGCRGHRAADRGEFDRDSFAHGRAEGPHHGESGPHSGHGGWRPRIARMAQHAYERGFDAGFDRGATAR